MPLLRSLFILIVPWLWLWTALAQAAPLEEGVTPAAVASSFGHDYEVHHKGWNGLSDFSQLVGELGCPVAPRTVLDWDGLDGHDVLVFLYPESRIPERELVAFLSAGGRVVLADDFGQGGPALSALRIERRTSPLPPGVRKYRDNPALPIADPVRATGLSHAAPELVANHPSAFAGPLLPTYAFAPGAGLVIEGTLGRGRFVAIADPSLFINNMLKLPGNREFAARLVADLCRLSGEHDRLLLFHGAFTSRGTPAAVLPGAPAAFGLYDLPGRFNRALSGANLHIQETLSRDRLAAGLDAASLAGLALTVAVLLLLLRYLPLSPVSHDAAFAQPARTPETGLFAALLRHARGNVPWGHAFPAALLREEVLLRLSPYLTPPLGAGRRQALRPAEVEQALSSRVNKNAGRAAAALWRELRTIPGMGNLGDLGAAGITAPISARRLRRLHTLAVILFAEIARPDGKG